MKTCKLLVSVAFFDGPPSGRSLGTPSGSLCAGHPLQVSDENSGGRVKCITIAGTEVWIEESYVSHATEGTK